ncbi:proteasome accessory factor C [Nocardioides luteus]|uniref:Protein pafC n=1 Tax=Nocardioides luteus TaxID=1844 RepID=A0ABQ5SZ10_9ACTN|nr:WYL domain-containing protein [Nocardioides luteus]MDR7310802.1 proteasome accessory factor C [Nocardioides luteus]GGR40551.1 protein pafC [Nocardioides luteus]GLJ69418.1 protein pafC [Nocardioides luteus]
MSERQHASGAKGQVGRLLTLVPYLYSQETDVRLDKAAADLGVEEKQLVKDLQVLFMCGLPGGYPDDLIDVDIDALTAPDGDRVIRISNADYLDRQLRLTPTEATAVIVALRALRGGAVSAETKEVVDRTLAKLEQAAAEGAAGSVDPGEETIDTSLVQIHAAIATAIDQGRQVRIDYWVPARDEESSRVVDPRALVSIHDVEYLDAWCHRAEAPRSFRLDRIRGAEVLDTPVVAAPESGERADLASEAGAERTDAGTVVRVRLAPDARWVAEYYSVIDPVEQPDGGLEVGVRVYDQRWLTRLLMRLAPHAELVEIDGEDRSAHAQFTGSFATTARQALGLYRSNA